MWVHMEKQGNSSWDFKEHSREEGGGAIWIQY